MAWQEVGGAITGGNNVPIDPNVHWLGTRNAAPLIIRTENGGGGPNPAAEAMRVTAAAQGRRVGIGTDAPNRALHVQPSEIHTGGGGAGYSFGNREAVAFVEGPAAGERWVWYATQGTARLWSGTDKLAILPNGNVGLGTPAPQGRLDVRGDIRAGNSDIYFTLTNHNHTGIGNTAGFAAIENAADYGALMILGRAGTPRGRSVRLWDYLEVNGSLDVTNNVTAARGVVGRASAGTNGILGTTAIRGVSAVIGQTNVDDAYAVFGRDNGNGWAGYFEGFVQVSRGAAPAFANLWVDGEIRKRSGGFRIDHPFDPKNKCLQHSFVESPDMKNVYDGVQELDADGNAWVELPEWFDALNRDFRYQLTVLGGSAPDLYVAQEISGNRFRIAGGREGMKVCWQVTGIRQDEWAEGHRIEVEPTKSEKERGHYSQYIPRDAPEEQDVMVGSVR